MLYEVTPFPGEMKDFVSPVQTEEVIETACEKEQEGKIAGMIALTQTHLITPNIAATLPGSKKWELNWA